MCRLFGMSGGPERVAATFWLIDAPDSLAQQSRREPDGTGLGTFDERGRPVVEKQPIAAYEDQQFARAALSRDTRAARARAGDRRPGWPTPPRALERAWDGARQVGRPGAPACRDRRLGADGRRPGLARAPARRAPARRARPARDDHP